MKIAVIGVGAMGSIYAALLADAGHEVWAVDTWGAHVDAINTTGLRVQGASGDRTLTTIRATTEITDVGTCDLCILATKAAGVGPAAQAAAPVIGPDATVLTIQNGLGAGERIAQHIPAHTVLLGVADARADRLCLISVHAASGRRDRNRLAQWHRRQPNTKAIPET